MIIKLKGIKNGGKVYVEINGVELTPEYSQKVRNHSPDGFEWGYGGSGPAQLALAIMLNYAIVNNKSTDTAVKHYQNFKWKEIATISDDKFEKEIEMEEYFK